MLQEMNPRVRMIEVTLPTGKTLNIGQLHLSSGDTLGDQRILEIKTISKDLDLKIPT